MKFKSKEEVYSLVVEAWQLAMETDDEFDNNESIFTYGGNSLHIVKIAEYFKTNYFINLEIETIFDHDTINLLTDYIWEICKV